MNYNKNASDFDDLRKHHKIIINNKNIYCQNMKKNLLKQSNNVQFMSLVLTGKISHIFYRSMLKCINQPLSHHTHILKFSNKLL